MNCAVHTDAPATGYCRNCGKALCEACTHSVRNVLYCEDCLASVMGHAPAPAAASAAPLPASPAAPAYGGGNPALAFILGFCVPGLGAVYNGEYGKALVHVAIFAAMVVGLSSGLSAGAAAALGIMLGVFVFYMAFDAMHVAQARRAGRPSSDALETWSANRPIGPIILILLGGIFLLGNFGVFDWDRIAEFWPVILIVIGILMLGNRLKRS